MPEDKTWSKQQERQEQEQAIAETLSHIENKLIVMSGKGGVGKSTVAANLAEALAMQGYRVGLMDVDLHGPSIFKLLGLEGQLLTHDDQYIFPITGPVGVKVVSMAGLTAEKDVAIIWRGPRKIGAIRQFIADVKWGELDYLVIDAPPGTGDEPLTVAQTVNGAKAIIVTTPQQLAVIDIRRSITFCKQVEMPVVGIIENMSGFTCPHCGKATEVFKVGGGKETAESMDVRFLGAIPLDAEVVANSDQGKAYLCGYSEAAKSFGEIVSRIIEEETPKRDVKKEKNNKQSETRGQRNKEKKMKIAVPVNDGKLSEHFGHCEKFAIIEVENGEVKQQELLAPPPHEPGLLPRWLKEQGAGVIIAGGMGRRAQDLFTENGIKVIFGASQENGLDDLVRNYLEGKLETGDNICDH